MTKSSLSVPWIYYQVLLRGLAAVSRAWYGLSTLLFALIALSKSVLSDQGDFLP